MKIEKEILDDHQAKLTVEFEQEILEGEKRKAARKIAKRVKIPGFRPGKAPYGVVESHVGAGAILEDAIDSLLDEYYPKVLEEAELDPYGPGSLQDNSKFDPLILEFLVPLAPVVELPDYRAIRIPFESKDVDDAEIEKSIDELREQQAIIEPVDRPAQEGDQVQITLNAEKKDAAEDDEEKSIISEQSFPVLIEKEDKDTEDEWPYPGYSRTLIGLSAKESKEVEFTYPEDFYVDTYKGVTGIFHTQIDEVKARKLPEKDDEFAKSVGEFETMQELLEDLAKTIQERLDNTADGEYGDAVLEKIIEDSVIKFPPQMLAHEIDHSLEDLTQSITRDGLTLEIYLKNREIEEEELREEYRPEAEKRIKRSLVMVEASKAEKIEASEEEVIEKADKSLDEFRSLFSPEDAKKFFTTEYIANLRARVHSDEVMAQTLDRLRMIAKGEDVPSLEEDSEDENSDQSLATEEAQEAETPNETGEPTAAKLTAEPSTPEVDDSETTEEIKEPTVEKESVDQSDPSEEDENEETSEKEADTESDTPETDETDSAE